jgi:hypothetical protein
MCTVWECLDPITSGSHPLASISIYLWLRAGRSAGLSRFQVPRIPACNLYCAQINCRRASSRAPDINSFLPFFSAISPRHLQLEIVVTFIFCDPNFEVSRFVLVYPSPCTSATWRLELCARRTAKSCSEELQMDKGGKPENGDTHYWGDREVQNVHPAQRPDSANPPIIEKKGTGTFFLLFARRPFWALCPNIPSQISRGRWPVLSIPQLSNRGGMTGGTLRVSLHLSWTQTASQILRECLWYRYHHLLLTAACTSATL